MPWALATSADARFCRAAAGGSSADFKPPRSAAILKAYMPLLMLAASKDPAVFRKWGLVLHLVAPPSTLFAPDMVAKALWWGLRRAMRLL